jgi:hypothetical protein
MHGDKSLLQLKPQPSHRKLSSCRKLEDVITKFQGTPIRLCQDISIEMLYQIIPQEETEITEVVKLLNSTFSEFLLSVQNSQNTFLESDFLDLYSVNHVNKQI